MIQGSNFLGFILTEISSVITNDIQELCIKGTHSHTRHSSKFTPVFLLADEKALIATSNYGFLYYQVACHKISQGRRSGLNGSKKGNNRHHLELLTVLISLTN